MRQMYAWYDLYAQSQPVFTKKKNCLNIVYEDTGAHGFVSTL